MWTILLVAIAFLVIMHKLIFSLCRNLKARVKLHIPSRAASGLAGSISYDSNDGSSVVASAPFGVSSQLHVPGTGTKGEVDLDFVKARAEAHSAKQPYDAFLVLDVEATCVPGTDFNWPNEIIEWPVCLLRWQDKNAIGEANELTIVDEFRSFVKPIWRPVLSDFCTSLTGITQTDVEPAPEFPKVLDSFSEFLSRNGLIDSVTGERNERFAWCTDGPFDIRDFVVKQCFISKITMPDWLRRDVIDVRKAVENWLTRGVPATVPSLIPKRLSLNIPRQLKALGLSGFEGREHSGIDDARNIARILIELARVGVKLEPNMRIRPGRRWQWMGKQGEILEEYCTI